MCKTKTAPASPRLSRVARTGSYHDRLQILYTWAAAGAAAAASAVSAYSLRGPWAYPTWNGRSNRWTAITATCWRSSGRPRTGRRPAPGPVARTCCGGPWPRRPSRSTTVSRPAKRDCAKKVSDRRLFVVARPIRIVFQSFETRLPLVLLLLTFEILNRLQYYDTSSFFSLLHASAVPSLFGTARSGCSESDLNFKQIFRASEDPTAVVNLYWFRN